MRSAPRAVLLAVCAAGCASLDLKKIDLSARPPSNVVVYFTVDRGNGDPLPGLSADKFRITENGRKLSPADTQQTLLDRRLVATHDVLVLVDMSSAMTKSKALVQLDSAIDNFVLKLGNETTIGVYAFDGGEDIVPLVPLPTGPGPKKERAPGEAPRFLDFEQRDPSANLHGAVRVALETLSDALDKAPKPLHFGTLVVISAGPDRADRVSQAKMYKALARSTKFDMFAIGLGPNVDKDEIKQIGRTFTVMDPEPTMIKRLLDGLADRLLQRAKRFYLLSYCSPARRGKRQLRIEATAPDGATGTLESKFDAEGFGPKCDPETQPVFTGQPAGESEKEEAPEKPEKPEKPTRRKRGESNVE